MELLAQSQLANEEAPPPLSLCTLSSDCIGSIALHLHPCDVCALCRAGSHLCDATRPIRVSAYNAAAKEFHDHFTFKQCGLSAGCRSITLSSSPKHLLLVDDAFMLTFLLQSRPADAAPIEELVFDVQGGVTSGAVIALAKLLPQAAPRLTTLSLSSCCINDVGANALAECVVANGLSRLTALFLEDNRFSATARARLRCACKTRGVILSAYSEIENESLYSEAE